MTEAVRVCVLLFSLVGCADAEKSKGGDECDSSIASADRIVGTVDGEEWDGAPVIWMWAGDSIQATSEEEDGWRMTFFLQATEDGLTMRDLEEGGALPATVDLGSDDAGVTLYTDDGDSYTTGADAPGSLTITQMDDATLEACFSFTAESSLGVTVEISEGAFYAGLFE